jgi:hypothetical protein
MLLLTIADGEAPDHAWTLVSASRSAGYRHFVSRSFCSTETGVHLRSNVTQAVVATVAKSDMSGTPRCEAPSIAMRSVRAFAQSSRALAGEAALPAALQARLPSPAQSRCAPFAVEWRM